MSLLDNASLVLTPNAYKEGKLYSVIPSNGNGDFTATRATTATRVNSAGLVDLVPYNLVQQSEVFSNAYWVKTNSSISANVTTAPDGTLTADKLVENTTSTSHQVLSSSNSVVNGATYTSSIYAKASERNWLLVIYFDGTTVRGRYFDLANGVGGSNWPGTPVTNTITSVGNGWYRITLTFAATSNACTLGYYLANADNSNIYTGDGTSGVFIWGAQLVEGTSARDYLRTETRLNIPRIDYSLGGCPNILLEPQRTNLALQSSSFDSAPSWGYVNSSVTANTTISPSGIQDADTLTANGTSNQHYAVGTASGSVTSGVAYTMSVYMKKGTNNFAQLWLTNTIGGMWANFDLNNGVVGSLGTTTGTPPTSAIQSVGNGWYRCIMTFTPTTTAAVGPVIGIITSASSVRGETNTLSTSVFLWGAQLEAGAYATSYIPTTTASVTRNADSITRNNIFTNGLITAAGGTWFVELRNNVSLIADNATLGLWLGTSNATSSSNGTLYFRQGGGASRVQIWKFTGGTGTSLFSTTTDTTKVAIKWNGTTADIFVNGVKQVSATAFAHNNMEFLNNSTGRNTFINEMAIFPTPLTDAQCLALTA